MKENKINILFVDYDKDALDGYKRMLYSMRKRWNNFLVSTGEKALKILNEKDIDVIITDIKLSDIDGTELLEKVKEEHPEILRIILSGSQDKFKVIKTTKTAHQFLTKPCDAEEIRKTIENAYLLRYNLENQDLLKLINGIGELPSLPNIFMELEGEINTTEPSFNNIEKIISRDPGLTAKILHTVNSGFFGLRAEITNLLEALQYLGTNTIKSIVLYLYTFSADNMKPEHRFYCESIGEHSLRVAQQAKAIASLEKCDKTTADEIFIAGILHDIGNLILVRVPGFIEKRRKLREREGLSIVNADLRILNVSHEWVGAYLLGLWGIPKNVVQAAAFHHRPGNLSQDNFNVLTALYTADIFENYSGEEFDVEKMGLDMDYLETVHCSQNVEYWWNETAELRKI